MHPVFIQAIYYGIVIVIATGIIGLLLKGFFWKYVKVRMSFGRLILIKVRAINRDHFLIGKIEKGFLVFNYGHKEHRVKIDDRDILYKCLAVTMVDLDEEKFCLCKADYSTAEGFDAQKYSDLYTRALYRPSIEDRREKIIFIIIIGIGISVLVLAGLTWMVYKNQTMLLQAVQTIKTSAPVITAGGL